MEHITKRLEQISFKKSFTKKYPNNDFGPNRKITIYIRFNDECKNGHNSFAITGNIYKPGNRDFDCCGCIHDEIKQHFPEFAKYIPYHLVSSDGPLHYIMPKAEIWKQQEVQLYGPRAPWNNSKTLLFFAQGCPK